MNRRRHRRRRPRSPPAPLENDDLLSEILLRLAPLPSSLPCASAVCKQWRRLVSDPRFLRRFRIHHSRSPPLLGFFGEHYFEPTMDPPNRIPTPDDSFYSFLGEDDGVGHFQLFGSRHGLVLIFDRSRNQVLVLDPFNGDRHRIAVPPDFDEGDLDRRGCVSRRRRRTALPSGLGNHTGIRARRYSDRPCLLVGDWRMGCSHLITASTQASHFRDLYGISQYPSWAFPVLVAL
ncbi:uncharacterized protein [Triticum aestivum]|uniref:uncharacterized protein isoform X2 n=1 Tax=Triticum aestivum TaxID=4565 RepID=UPI001D0168B1|nr:uncharacterized protein LOC123135907 isoform X2 [Triticum aestivum]